MPANTFVLQNGGFGAGLPSSRIKEGAAVHREMAASIERQLNPAAADPRAAERQRQFEEGLKIQAAQMRAIHRSCERKAIIDQRYRDTAEEYLDRINRLEKSGQFREAKLQRIALTNLLAQLERECE